MRFGRTLAVYFGILFTRMVLVIFLVCFGLIAVIDYIELAQRTLYLPGADAWNIFLVSLFRVPSVAESVLPFAVLFGAIAAFITANRRLELVVARSAGVSAWQFLAPGAAVGLVMGIVASTLYNPAAAMLKEQSLIHAAGTKSPRKPVNQGGGLWLRQDGSDGESIIGAAESRAAGTELVQVTALRFNRDGTFRERIEAGSATFKDNHWLLKDAMVIAPSRSPATVAEYAIPTFLSVTQIREALANPETVSFWGLPRLIRIAEQSGLPADRFRLQFHTLLSRPILLLAMVLIAGGVTLRFNRMAGLGGMILAGVIAGFVLYVANEIARDLGSGGLVSPVFAAWLPAIMATLISVTILLRREDG